MRYALLFKVSDEIHDVVADIAADPAMSGERVLTAGQRYLDGIFGKDEAGHIAALLRARYTHREADPAEFRKILLVLRHDPRKPRARGPSAL